MPNKNLLELCLSPSLGGLELYMMHTAKALNDEFNVTSVVASGAQLEPYFKDTQYKYIAIKHKGASSFFSAIKLARIIDENNIDIVHLHWTSDLPTTVIAKLFAKKKFKLVQSRHMHMTRFKNDIYHRYLYKKMDLILPVTRQLAGQINKFIPKSIRPRVEVLYLGAERIEQLDEGALQIVKKELGMAKNFCIGMVGRIEEEKGQLLLIEAVSRLRNKGLQVEAFFVGNPTHHSYLESIKEDVEIRGLEKYIHFLGFMKNPHHFMQACDAMVLATPCETFGLVLIEAMQAKTTVLATNACGPLEIIDDKKNGLLYEKGSIEDLSIKIEILVKDKVYRDSLALAGQEKAEEQFSALKQFKRLANILKGL